MANAVWDPVNNGERKISEEDRRIAEQLRLQKARQKQTLTLQRENILSQKTSNPARRSALESALAQIEAQLKTFS
jgi:hypothetical protein